MTPRFENLAAKTLVGLRRRMSLADDRTAALWGAFMPLRHVIGGRVGEELLSLQVYAPGYFEAFSPHTEFEKWAAVEVPAGAAVPAGLAAFHLPGGRYAVFEHRGGPRTGPQTFAYLFGTWLPASGYRLDDRPHFEVLGNKYNGGAADSEEEIWIPIKPK